MAMYTLRLLPPLSLWLPRGDGKLALSGNSEFMPDLLGGDIVSTCAQPLHSLNPSKTCGYLTDYAGSAHVAPPYP